MPCFDTTTINLIHSIYLQHLASSPLQSTVEEKEERVIYKGGSEFSWLGIEVTRKKLTIKSSKLCSWVPVNPPWESVTYEALKFESQWWMILHFAYEIEALSQQSLTHGSEVARAVFSYSKFFKLSFASKY